MKLEINIKETDNNADARVKEAKQAKKVAGYQPTIQEVFIDGWVNPKTGKRKKAIRELKNAEKDAEKIQAVYKAICNNVIGLDGMTTKQLSKTVVLTVLYPKLVAIKKEETIREMKENCPDNYVLVNNHIELGQMIEDLINEEAFAFDTETTGLTHEDFIVGYSVSCPKADRHYYVPFRHETGEYQLAEDDCLMAVEPFLIDSSKLKVLANSKFDYKMLVKEGIKMVNFVDVQTLMYVLNENEPSYKLKVLATKYGKQFGFEDKSDTYEELFGNGGFENTPIDVGYIYACKDTHLTWNMCQWQLSHLKKQPNLWKIAFEIETPLTPVLLDAELTGFNIDMEYAEKYLVELKQEVSAMENSLNDYFPDINLNSNQQLADYLFNELKLEKIKGDSVDKDVLKALAPQYKGIEVLLEYRKLAKLMSTYIEPLPKMVWEDGNLHGELNQRGTKTGRLASKKPNLQNIPPAARKIFVAPEGKLYMSCDFSKMEVFLACELSDDPNLFEALHGGADVYSALASKSYGLPIEECGDGTVYRKHSKTALLGCMYGALPFTIAKQVGVSVEEGEQILRSFFDGNPVLTKSIHACHALVEKQGYVETITGRKRRFPEIPQKCKLLKKVDDIIKRKTGRTGEEWVDAEGSIWKCKRIPYDLRQQWWKLSSEIQKAFRQSFNATVQGSGGDICKISLINLAAYFEELNNDLPPEKHYKIISSIHDEQLMEVPEDIPEEVIKQIDYIMCNTMPLKVTMKTDIEFYKTYYHDGKSITQVLAGDLPQKLEV